MSSAAHEDLRARLRERVTERLGFARSAMPDARVDRALARLPAGGLEALPLLGIETPAWQIVITTLVVGETRFFRHAPWFAQLAQTALATVIAQRRLSGNKRLRIWSAACATGEETYGLAMLVATLLPDHAEWSLSITGTDINEEFLTEARAGIYHARSLRELPAAMRELHFHAAGSDRFAISGALRASVSFELHNLAAGALPQDARFTDLDLIVCRNVLIYLTPERQQAVAGRFAERLDRHGWLAVAPAEAVADWYRPLRPVNLANAIFFQHPPRAATPSGARRPLPPPAAPRKHAAPPSTPPAPLLSRRRRQA